MSAFRGWPAEALSFYAGLEDDNSKAYWQAHKATYEAAVKGPTEALLAMLSGEFGAPKMFRPYRDTRFAADKSPYKTAAGALCGDTFYVQVSADGLMTAAGSYDMAPDQVERLRRAVADDRSGSELEEIVRAAEKARFEIGGEALKIVPRGYPKDHPRARLLRHRGLYGWRMYPPAKWLHTAKAADKVAADWRALRPLADWLAEHVGPSGQ